MQPWQRQWLRDNQELLESVHQLDKVAVGLGAAGLALLGGGVLLWATGGPSSQPKPSHIEQVEVGVGSVRVRAAW